jgi:hypothetical protein
MDSIEFDQLRNIEECEQGNELTKIIFGHFHTVHEAMITAYSDAFYGNTRDEFFCEVFQTKEQFEDKHKVFEFIYRNSVRFIVESIHQDMRNNHSGIDVSKYPNRVLDRIVKIQRQEWSGNNESIVIGYNKLSLQPVEHHNVNGRDVYIFNAPLDCAMICDYYCKVSVETFNTAVLLYKDFVAETSRKHAELMENAIRHACGEYSVSGSEFLKDSHSDDTDLHTKQLQAFDAYTKENACEIISRNYPFVTTWCILKRHFNAKKFAKQISLDMYLEQSAIEMQRRYIISTFRENANYDNSVAFVTKLAVAYQRNQEIILDEDERKKNKLNKLYDGMDETDSKIMDDIMETL